MTLRTLQDYTVRPALLRVDGVADVVSYGGLVREVHVTPDPARMSALGVSIAEVFAALAKSSANATGGTVERGAQAFVIKSLGVLRSLDDLRAVRVAVHDGVPVRVRDVGTVTYGYQPRQGVVTRGGDEDAVEGIVLMRRGENPSVVLAALRQAVAQINGHALPDGVRVVPFYDRTDLVDTTLHTVFHNLLEGALLVTSVLLVFLLSIQASLIVAVIIPLSLAASFLYLYMRGMSANLLSMGAIDFGIIVDGAVILVEHIFHHQDRPIEHVAREVARPTLYSLLIIIAAYLPIFALQRVEGRIFSPMANTVVSALLGAMLLSFTLVPVLCAYALRRRRHLRESPLLVWAKRAHVPTLAWSLRNPATVFVAALGLLVAAGTLVPRLGSEFLPELNEGSLYVTFTLPATMSLSEGRKLTPRVKKLLARTPEVVDLLSQLGRPEDGTDPTLQNNLEVFVKLKPLDDWRPNKKTLDDLIAEMDGNLKEVPGIEYNFSQPIRDNVNENISGQFGLIAVKIYGDDLDQLSQLAGAATDAIAGVPGVADLGIVKASASPAIGVKLDRDALARYDLDMADVQDFVETALGGHTAAELWEGEKKLDVVVRLPPGTRDDVNAIRQLRLPLKDGALVPLSALGAVKVDLGRAAITRENGKRYVGIRMNVRNRDLGSFVAEAMAKVAAKVSMPVGYEVTWGGEFENQERAMARLTLVLPLALILTFLLLFSSFGTVWDAALILVNVPFALIGGVLGLALAHMTLSVSAAVGFIALLGQAVLNGVLVVAAIRGRRERGEALWDAVVGGTADRLRAVLMTALLASLGLVPAALSHAIGSETQRPIAVVVVWGTVTAAALTLVVLPVTYYYATWLRERIVGRLGVRAGVAEDGA
jgi:cobalt-zinc-cadmium resistance protein CzcA